MISIGNDIIALNKTNPERTKQARFYSKIICKQELEVFKEFDEGVLRFDHFVWLAWSIKESVYKFQKRYDAEALFSPAKIIIQKIHIPKNIFLLNDIEHEAISFVDEFCFCCKVYFDSEVFYTRSLICNELIFTVANNSNQFKNIYWGMKIINNDSYKTQSKTVRQFTLDKLNQLSVGNNFNIEKTEAGYPFIKEKKHIPLSFSHHGNFVGYAFKLK